MDGCVPTLPLKLSGYEVIFLVDGIRNSDRAEGLIEEHAYIPLAREALLLLGSAYKELVSTEQIRPGPVELQITEEVAWLLRGHVRTGDIAIDGKTNVGIGLLLNLYDILIRFNSGVADLEAVAVEEAEKAEVEAKRILEEEANARGKTDPGPDEGRPDNGADKGTGAKDGPGSFVSGATGDGC